MKKSSELIKTNCLNCGTSVAGEYCQECGQRVRENSDRSLKWLLREFFSNFFFLDNRFVQSLNSLLRFPGRMTVEFLSGKRRKFISPVTLFLFCNLIYFFVSPLTDYSLPLEDQIYEHPYSEWATEKVIDKLRKEEMNYETYVDIYQKASDTISKSIMIINVPIIALFVFFMTFRKRRYYFDHLIFTFHYFSLFLLSWVMIKWVDKLLQLLSDDAYNVLSEVSYYLFVFGIPFVYGVFSMKRFLNVRWSWAIPAGVGALASVLIANMFYRFIIFVVTFWYT